MKCLCFIYLIARNTERKLYMSGSSFGKLFRITTWGESHGPGVGVVIDGCPAGIALSEQDIQAFLDRRRPGQSKYTTKRNEADTVSILSGIFEGRTTGTPISLVVYNKDQRSKDYGDIAVTFRPGHADYPYKEKYGFRDYRGGGRSSGRETIGRVAAGAVASLLLKELGITVRAYTKAIGPFSIPAESYNYTEINENSFYMPDNATAEKAGEYVAKLMSQCNSCGGVIECTADGLPVGLGEPFFGSVESLISHAVFSIPGVRGIEFGDGFRVSRMRGSEHNDPISAHDGSCSRNGAGGINGGITNGNPVVFRVAFKPTSSIRKTQHTYNFTKGEVSPLEIPGRHDTCFALRTPVVVEAVAAMVFADLKLLYL